VTLLARRTLEDAQAIQNTLQVRLIPWDDDNKETTQYSITGATGAATNENGDPEWCNMTRSNQTCHIVEHFYFSAWPDHGIPSHAGPIVRLAKTVDQVNNNHHAVPTTIGSPSSNNDLNGIPTTAAAAAAIGTANASITERTVSWSPPSGIRTFPPIPPIMVHCSAGIGRTGTFIAISSILRAYDLLDDDRPSVGGHVLDPCHPPPQISPLGSLNTAGGGILAEDMIAREVDGLREQRPGMLQRPEQTLFVYCAVAEALLEREGENAARMD